MHISCQSFLIYLSQLLICFHLALKTKDIKKSFLMHIHDGWQIFIWDQEMNEFTAVHFLDFEGRTMKFNDIYLVTICKKYLFSKSTCVARKCNFPSPDAYLYFYLNFCKFRVMQKFAQIWNKMHFPPIQNLNFLTQYLKSFDNLNNSFSYCKMCLTQNWA